MNTEREDLLISNKDLIRLGFIDPRCKNQITIPNRFVGSPCPNLSSFHHLPSVISLETLLNKVSQKAYDEGIIQGKEAIKFQMRDLLGVETSIEEAIAKESDPNWT